MLCLLFQLGDDLYALETKAVIEVIPMVAMKRLPSSPHYVMGQFNYRGQIVPAIDLKQLVHGAPCQQSLSTRIMLVVFSAEKLRSRLVGLVAERVTETLDKQRAAFVSPGIRSSAAPYLGGLAPSAQGMIQLLEIDALCQKLAPELLEPEPAEG